MGFENVMNRAIIGVAASALAFPGIAIAQSSKTVEFSSSFAPVTVTQDGVEVTLQPTEQDGLVAVAAAIRVPGFQSIIVQETATMASAPHVIGIGKLTTSDAAPSILVGGYSGGAHCCATLKVVTPWNGRLKVLELEPIDGGPNETFPSDVNGDGVVDLVRQDDNFRYAFSSGAGSYSPPVVFNIFKGQLVDVSEDPTFRPLWEKFAARTAKACFTANTDRNGACIAYVAASTRLGRYQEALKSAVRAAEKGADLPVACKVKPVDYSCPTGQELKFYTFESAAVWFLREHGYADGAR